MKIVVDATKERMLPVRVGMEIAGSQPMLRMSCALCNSVRGKYEEGTAVEL